jgi:hypothetical protein
MKKFLTLLVLALTLCSVFSVAVFAEGEDGGNIVIAEQIFFEEAYEFISDNADKILSALAAIASFALAVTYRRGLLPLLKGGLGTLSGTVSTLKESTAAAEDASREILTSAKDKLESAEELISELSEKLSKIEEELAVTKEEEKRAADLRLLLGTQIDLLHDIFMSSSLPYYRKEEVGEKVAEMKKALSSSEEEVNE